MIGDGDSLSQREELGEGYGFFKRGLADQRGCEIIDGVVLVIVNESDFVKEVRFEEVGFVDDDHGLDFLLGVEFFDGGKDLVGDVGLSELRYDTQPGGDLCIKSADIVHSTVEIDDAVRLRAEGFQDGADGGGLSAPDFSGEQTDAAIDEEHAQAVDHFFKERVHEKICRFNVFCKRNVGEMKSCSQHGYFLSLG